MSHGGFVFLGFRSKLDITEFLLEVCKGDNPGPSATTVTVGTAPRHIAQRLTGPFCKVAHVGHIACGVLRLRADRTCLDWRGRSHLDLGFRRLRHAERATQDRLDLRKVAVGIRELEARLDEGRIPVAREQVEPRFDAAYVIVSLRVRAVNRLHSPENLSRFLE